MDKISRNQSCPCGSGKKFKKCCLEKDNQNQAQYIPYRTLVEKVFEFIKRLPKEKYEEEITIAYDTFFGQREDLPCIDSENLENQGLFNEWLTYDFVFYGRETEEVRFVDLFIKEQWDTLSDQEKALIESLRDSRRTIVEIRSTQPGVGIEVKDLFTDKIYFVHELRGSTQLVKWDCCFVRLYQDTGKWHFSGQLMMINRADVPPLVGLIKATALMITHDESGKRLSQEAVYKKLLKIHGYLLSREVVDCIKNDAMPMMTTTTGEEFVSCTLTYKITDYKSVFHFLQNRFEQIGKQTAKCHQYGWINSENTVIASFILRPNILEVVTNSIQRSEKVKKLLEKHAKEFINLQGSRQKSLEEIFEEKEDDQEENNFYKIKNTPEDKTLEEAMFKRYYGDWERTPIPLLNSMTPLKAMKGAEGRELLTELFKIYENHQLRGRKQGLLFNTIDVVSRLKEKIKFRQ